VILENEYHRIGVESVVGVQDSFHRYIDSDMVYFQFCGNSTVETEFGVYEMEPGEVMLVPGGIAHRSIGRNDSLRYFCQSHEAVDYVMKEDQYTSQTSFEVKRIGGPNWTAPQGANAPAKGPVVEKMHFWDDGPDDQTVVERDYESLVGVAGLRRGEPGSHVRKLRAFDHFTAIVGKGREDAGTQPLMESANMRIRTYNMQDEQFAFHRALRSEEVRIQFRGDALDLSEFENVEVSPGEITIIPLGISHSVISIPPEDGISCGSTFTARSAGASRSTRPSTISTASLRSKQRCTSRPRGGRNFRRRGDSRKSAPERTASLFANTPNRNVIII
jgi:mannose-6-phosphate isomerase-like protein (cupin superfamily)